MAQAAPAMPFSHTATNSRSSEDGLQMLLGQDEKFRLSLDQVQKSGEQTQRQQVQSHRKDPTK